jgi:ATP-dependent exoDNAse (exonuclease V) alpha subunit
VVGHSEIVVSDNAPDWAKGLAEDSRRDYPEAAKKLVDLVERSESRHDAQLFREFQVTVPRVFSDDQAIAYLKDVSRFLADKGMLVDLAYHRYGSGHDKSEPVPDDVALQVRDGQKTPDGDHVLWKGGKWYRYQPHGHLLTLMRPMTERGLGAKRVPYIIDREQQLNAKGKAISVPTTPWGDRDFLEEVRTAVHVLAREHLAQHGVEYTTPWERVHGRDNFLPVEPTLGVEGHQAQRWAITGGGYQPGQAFYPATLVDYEGWRSASYKAALVRPELLLNSLTKTRATFSEGELNSLIAKLSRGRDELDRLHRVVMASDHLIALEKPERQHATFTTRDMFDAEHAALNNAVMLHERQGHAASPRLVDDQLAQIEAAHRAENAGWSFTSEQRDAVHKLTIGGDLASVEGFAGTGKTTLLSAVKAVREAQGFKVVGYALSQKAASEMAAVGIRSTSVAAMLETLALRDGIQSFTDTGVVGEPLKNSMLNYLRGQKKEAPSAEAKIDVTIKAIRDGAHSDQTKVWIEAYVSRIAPGVARQLWDRDTVVVLDEFVMIDSRAIAKLLEHARESGSMVTLAGDREQAQPIAAGGAASRILDYTDYASVQTIVRQKEEWQRHASLLFATQNTSKALAEYEKRGFIGLGHRFVEKDLIGDVERQVGSALSDRDKDNVVLLGRYIEARRAAGGILAAVDDRKDQSVPDEFWEWLQQRNRLAAEVGDRIEEMKGWLDKFGFGPRLIAVHALQGLGAKRDEAERGAQNLLKDWRLSGDREDDEPAPALRMDLRSGARSAQLEAWVTATAMSPDADVIMAAHTNHDVDALNLGARRVQHDRGVLGGEIIVETRHGPRPFSVNDRVMFLENFVDGEVRVQNGRTGRILDIDGSVISVALSGSHDGAIVAIDSSRYDGLAYGYAGTIHKFQGLTADRLIGQFSSGMDRHLTYVLGTRHREEFWMYSSAADAPTFDVLCHRAGVGNRQDSTLDYIANDLYQEALGASPPREALDSALRRVAMANSHVAIKASGGVPLPDALVEEVSAARAHLKEMAGAAAAVIAVEVRPFVAPQSTVDRIDHSLSEARRMEMLDGIEADPRGWLQAQLDRSVVVSEQHVRDGVGRFTRDQVRVEALLGRLRADPEVAVLHREDGAVFLSTQGRVATERSMLSSALGLEGLGSQRMKPETVALVLGQASVESEVRGIASEVFTGGGLHLVSGDEGLQRRVVTVLDQHGPQLGLDVRHGAATLKGAQQLPEDLRGARSGLYGLVHAAKTERQIREFDRTGVVHGDLLDGAKKYLGEAAAKSPEHGSRYQQMAATLGTGADPAAEGWLRGTYISSLRSRTQNAVLDRRSLLVVHDAHRLGPEIIGDVIEHARDKGAKVVLVGSPDDPSARSPMRVLEEHLRPDRAFDVDGGRELSDAAEKAAGGRAADALAEYLRQGRLNLGIGHARVATAPADTAAVHVADYVEARGAVKVMAAARLPYSDLTPWIVKRNSAVSAIADDINGHLNELSAAGVADAHMLARHHLQAAGLKAADARVYAADLVKEWGIGDGSIVAASTRTIDARGGARRALLDGWAAEVDQGSDLRNIMILVPSDRDRGLLNEAARSTLKDRGRLTGDDHLVPTDAGELRLVEGDRVRFGAYDGFLGVKAGDLGTVAGIQEKIVVIELDQGDLVAVPFGTYGGLQHGYALEVRQARDVPVDHTFLLYGEELSRRDLRTALTADAWDMKIYAAAADAPDVRVMVARAAPGEREASVLDFDLINPRAAAREDRALDDELSAYLALIRNGQTEGLEEAKSSLVAAMGRASPGATDRTIRTAMGEQSAGPHLAQWGKVGTGMLTSAARGDFVGFARSVLSGASMLAPTRQSGKHSISRARGGQIGAAQREFLAAAAEHRAARATGDTARLAAARVTLGERVLELSMHDRSRAAGIAQAMAGIDPVRSGARGWQSAADAVKVAQGVGTIVSGIVTGNPFKVALGIFKTASNAIKTGRGLTEQMNRGIDRG